ncbi:MAG: TIM barrel protein [Planctomycetes bacterium]|nr:TIM barrel protein [Planctomycetota bacterium]MBL7039757.1 TIM barrel protein [Pirellulaceae bacterium]
MSSQSRRTFLKGAASLGAVAIAGSEAARNVFGAENPVRLKYSKCNETFQDWPQEKIFKFIAECGYGGVEIAPFTISNYVTDISRKERTALRKHADEAKIRIVGLHWLLARTKGLHLTHPDAAVRRKTTEYLCELAKFCSELGGDVMVFGSPQQRNLLPGVSRDEGMKYAAEVFRGAMPTLEKLEIMLALEPLGTATNFMVTAADTVELAEMVDSPNCKLLLDCKAMVSESTPIPELIRKHGSWLIHFHANDANRRGPGMGDLDFVPIFEALRDIKYRGWVSVEVFDYSPGPEALARESIEYMKKVEARVFG